MAKIYSAKRAGKVLGLSHLQVLRRIRTGDIQAKKLDWNWLITEEAIEEAKNSDWYKKYLERAVAS